MSARLLIAFESGVARAGPLGCHRTTSVPTLRVLRFVLCRTLSSKQMPTPGDKTATQ